MTSAKACQYGKMEKKSVISDEPKWHDYHFAPPDFFSFEAIRRAKPRSS